MIRATDATALAALVLFCALALACAIAPDETARALIHLARP